VDEKINKIEKLSKEIENESDIDKSVLKFVEAAALIKAALADGKQQKGQIMEVIKDIDKLVERAIKLEED